MRQAILDMEVEGRKTAKGIVALRPYLGLTFKPTGIARGQA